MRSLLRFCVLVATMLAAMPIGARQGPHDDAVALWGGLTSATNKAEARQFMNALPKRRVELLPGCSATFMYRVVKGSLASVIFVVRDNAPDCRAQVLGNYRSELGEPEVGSAVSGSVLAFGDGDVLDTTSVGTKLTWREGEKKIKLIDTTKTSFNLIITMREDKYLY